MTFNASNWYWIVDGSTTQVYSSASASYVSTGDATFQAWLAAGNQPTRIIGNDMLKLRIDALEGQQTPRMYREAATASTNTFATGTAFAGLTSQQALASIQSQIAALRSQIT